MATEEQKQAIVDALRAALDVENTWTDEPSSYGDFLCHECRSRTSVDRGGCVNAECWIESAEQLLRMLSQPAKEE